MGAFSNLTWSVIDGTTAGAIGMGINYIQGKLGQGGREGAVKFYYQYENGGKIVNVLTRHVAGSILSSAKDFAVEQYRNFIKKNLKIELDKRASAAQRIKFIEKGIAKEKEKYGSITVNDGKNSVKALDDYGNVCYDALMLAIPSKKEVVVEENQYYYGNKITKRFSSDKLVWYDTTAIVNVSSSKNLVLTTVQGRDYSRKELISNGDINFSIQGHICSPYPDIYPREEVQKFNQIMKYKGVIEVNNEIFDQYGINKLIITSWSAPSREGYKAQQDYSFEAVGIQPDKEIEVTQDTINIINQEMVNEESQDMTWSKLLKRKLDNLKDLSIDAVSQGAALATGAAESALADILMDSNL